MAHKKVCVRPLSDVLSCDPARPGPAWVRVYGIKRKCVLTCLLASTKCHCRAIVIHCCTRRYAFIRDIATYRCARVCYAQFGTTFKLSIFNRIEFHASYTDD
jgi:hypothetical protein